MAATLSRQFLYDTYNNGCLCVLFILAMSHANIRLQRYKAIHWTAVTIWPVDSKNLKDRHSANQTYSTNFLKRVIAIYSNKSYLFRLFYLWFALRSCQYPSITSNYRTMVEL